MKQEENIMKYTARELKKMLSESKTDWKRVNKKTEAQIKKAIKSNPDSDVAPSKNWFTGI